LFEHLFFYIKFATCMEFSHNIQRRLHHFPFGRGTKGIRLRIHFLHSSTELWHSLCIANAPLEHELKHLFQTKSSQLKNFVL
jgi:hypothetical protein